MVRQLVCQHGHAIQVADDVPDDSQVSCHLCGARTRSRVDTAPVPSVLSSPRSNIAESGDHDASVFVTLGFDDESAPASTPSSFDALPSFVEISEGSMESERSSDSGGKSSVAIEPPQLPGYEIIKELGRGGMGVVYRARNESLGRDVALKTLQSMSPKALQRFKSEFRSIADVAHPNLASLHELLSDGKTWCFSMEILEGVEFLEYVWSGFDTLTSKPAKKTLTESDIDSTRLSAKRLERLNDAMRQLALGLSALHDAGILHSDI